MTNYTLQQPTQTYRQLYQQQPQNARVRPVTSLEEVKASSIDFDGSIFFFPDFANKRIYTKQIGMDGMAVLNMYALQDLPISEPATADYITREEFNSTLAELKTALQKINTSPAPTPQPAEQKQQEKTPTFSF